MQVQRSWQFSLVVTCLLSCVIAILCIVGMIVVVYQSSKMISGLGSALEYHETRIQLLESQNTDLRLMLEKIQEKLNQHEATSQTHQPDGDSSRQSTNDLAHYNSAIQREFVERVIRESDAKGDVGVLEESDVLSQMGAARLDNTDNFKVRTFRSSRRRQRNEEGRKECRRCKGEKGEQGDAGPVSYGGEKGQKGERGHRGEMGPPGECEYHTTTDSTTPMNTQGEGQPLWSAERPASLLAAHFEGGRLATINTGERWDPINRGIVNLSEIDGGWVPYWKYADWMSVEVKSKFVLNHPQVGNVTVTDGGIYYVYSQMLYYDPSVFMGHSLYIGEQKRFSCTECTVDRDRKFNTCYIGGVVQINPGEKVGVKVSYANRVINLHPDSTHFGLIKLS